jgi:hypothetical protein
VSKRNVVRVVGFVLVLLAAAVPAVPSGGAVKGLQVAAFASSSRVAIAGSIPQRPSGDPPEADFTSSCSNPKGDGAAGASHPTGAYPGLTPLVLRINGSEDLSKCMRGPNGAYVSRITVQDDKDRGYTIYRYRINITGKTDFTPNRSYLEYLNVIFTDKSGDTYSLHVEPASTERTLHKDYNSKSPNIAKIEWHAYYTSD